VKTELIPCSTSLHDNNRKMKFRLELLDGDGRPFELETPEGMKPLALDGDVTLTARPGLKPRSQITGLSAAILPPIALPASEQFRRRSPDSSREHVVCTAVCTT
jgi:hypothetical protein